MEFYAEYTNEQRRQLIDVQQAFGAWRPASLELYRMGGLYWNTSHGRRYLYEKREGRRRSLGRETTALAQRKATHDARGQELRKFVKPLTQRLERMAPVNRAMGLGRIPTIAAKILRALDEEGLLGVHLIVAGTNALFAYEAAAGVMIGGEHVATGDADLLWDTRQSLLLAATRVRRDGLMSILREVDPTFMTSYGFNPTNSAGYIVDLLTPESDDFQQMRPNADVEAQQMTGAEWLLQGPHFDQTIVGADGLPLRIVAPEPRTYALHKLWVSRRKDRTPIKRPRDIAHARVVEDLSSKYLGLNTSAKEMPWLPPDLVSLIPSRKKVSHD